MAVASTDAPVKPWLGFQVLQESVCGGLKLIRIGWCESGGEAL
jgi:hypothetical protein